MQESDILTVKDVQKILGIGRNTAYRLVNSGQFHTVRTGKNGLILIPGDSFWAWFKGSKYAKGDVDGRISTTD